MEHKRDLTLAGMIIIAALLLILTGIIACLFLVPNITPGFRDTLLATIAGSVLTGISACINYLWGSSSSSQAKDASILALSQTQAPNAIPQQPDSSSSSPDKQASPNEGLDNGAIG